MSTIHKRNRDWEAMNSSEVDDPETKWAPWKVTVSLLAFCLGFWAAVAYLVIPLFV